MTDDIRNQLIEATDKAYRTARWGENAWEVVADAILEAFDVSEKSAALSQPEQAEEWDYGTETLLHNHIEIMPHTKVNAMALAWRRPVYKRRKAGPWMPVWEEL